MTLDSHEIRLGNTYKIELGDGPYRDWETYPCS